MGGKYKRTEELKPLPKGDGRLKVQFSYDQRPAAGVKFFVALNGKFATEMTATDAGGEAEIPIPFGLWEINRLECRKWATKPAGRFTLISGDEIKLGSAPFDRMFYSIMDEGKNISLSKDNNPVQMLRIKIRSRMKIVWPMPNEDRQKATIAGSVIEWEPFPGAVSYVVQISRVTHESARSTTYRPILYKRVDGANLLALKELPNAPTDMPPEEYAIAIRAYDRNGSYLSKSEHSFSTIMLNDDRVLVELDDGTAAETDENAVERKFKARKALEAAAFLIGKEMYPEARKLLDQADVSALPGQAALINGYYNAAQGRCDEAEKHFSEASDLGETCIPERYRSGCNPD